MPATKLTCPECDATLNPSKPPAPGKKVRCPRCKEIFVVPEPDAESRGKSRTQAKAQPKKKTVPTKPKPEKKKRPMDDEDDVSAYALLGGKAGGEEDDAPEIDYIPDLEVKDPRGQVTASLMTPTNWMMSLSAIIAIGMFVMVCFWVWPFLFTKHNTTIKPGDIRKDMQAKQQADRELSSAEQSQLDQLELSDLSDTEKAEFFARAADEQQERAIWAVCCFFVMLYAAFVCMATVKMQNLESYKWSMTACIMAIPLVATMPFGIWGISFLKKDETISAFEYRQE